jgi:sugar phosphate permease
MKQFKPFLMVLIASLIFFYSFGLNNIFNAVQAEIANAFYLTPTMIGAISSVFFYAEIALLIPAGLLSDRVSPKKLITLALILSAVGVFLTGFAHTIAILILARVLMGIGGAFSFITCIRVAANWLQPQQLARGTGLIATMGILGGFVVQMPLVYLIEKLGWHQALFAVGILGLIMAIVTYLFLQDRPSDYMESDKNIDMLPMNVLHRFKLAFLNKQNFLCGTYTSLMNLAIFMLGAMWGITYLIHVNGLSTLQASFICSMLFLGTMVGSPLVGLISDKIASRRRPMQVGAILSVILILMIIFCDSQNMAILIALYFLLGLITSSQMISYPTVVESNSKQISSSSTSVISICSMLGGAIAQPLFGYVIYKSNEHATPVNIWGYRMAMGLLLLAFLLAFIVSNMIKETHGQSVN